MLVTDKKDKIKEIGFFTVKEEPHFDIKQEIPQSGDYCLNGLKTDRKCQVYDYR